MNLATIAGLVTSVCLIPLAATAADLGEHAQEEVVLPASGGVMTPDLPSIQTNLFTPGCALSFCHGAAMSANLDLREDASYTSLVDIRSVEHPTWDRVEPFNPNESFLICKLEACPELVGQQMPLIGGPLDQSVIDVIRAWVAKGAPESPGVAVDANTWGQVKAIYR
ncbi:MAG: hypothetical protein DHS20C21_14050 [Gemmatimonadota bacterium]|nr:MAG: hypothetical protein DHS20C21_14050 [Gemmatimonadota bacterium]